MAEQHKTVELHSWPVTDLSCPYTSVINHSIHTTGVNTHRLGSTFVLPHDLLYGNVFLLLIQLSHSLCQERSIIPCSE